MIKQVPKVHTNKLKNFLSLIKAVESKAQATMSTQALLDLTMSDITELAANANTHLSLVNGFLNSMEEA